VSAHCGISVNLDILSCVSAAQRHNRIHRAQPVSPVTQSVQLCGVRILITNNSCISSESKMKELSITCWRDPDVPQFGKCAAVTVCNTAHLGFVLQQHFHIGHSVRLRFALQ
jgi:hypothetical protein